MNVRARLAKLESHASATRGKVVVLAAGPTDHDIDEVLKANGIDRNDPAHEIVILRTIYESKDGGIEPTGQPRARLLSIADRCQSKPLPNQGGYRKAIA